MSAIFRVIFRMPHRVQLQLAALSAAAVGGGAISPAHVGSTGLGFAPSLRRSVSAAMLGGGQSFGSAAMRLTLKPVSIGSSSVYFAAAIDTGSLLSPASLTNGQSFGALRLTLHLSPAAYANAGSVYAPTAGSLGVIGAPLVGSGGAVHAPRVDGAPMFEVVGTLSAAGWTPRSAGRKPRAVAWPNLPKVEAPPWRLMVVTPEVARERARSFMTRRRRDERARHAREEKRKLGRYLDEIIEAEIAHAVVRLVSEDA